MTSADKSEQVPYSVTIERQLFLRAIQQRIPLVLEKLATDVFPRFKALFREGWPGKDEWGYVVDSPRGTCLSVRWESANAEPDPMNREVPPLWIPEFGSTQNLDPARTTFVTEVERWTRSHKLFDVWIKDEMLSTLSSWLQPQRPRLWFFRPPILTGPDSMPGPTLHIEESWSPEPWRTVNMRVQGNINTFKSQYQEFSKRVFDANRIRRRRHHYEWLALFQCNRQSPAKIKMWHQDVNGKTVTESAVTHSVKTAATRIGLTLRQSASRGNAST